MEDFFVKVVALTVQALLGAFVVWLTWPVAETLFGVPSISYVQSIILWLLCDVLFRGK